jgi:hypothetical protein
MATATDRTAFDHWAKESAEAPVRPQPPTTVSGVPIEALYTPEQLDEFEPETDLGYRGTSFMSVHFSSAALSDSRHVSILGS